MPPEVADPTLRARADSPQRIGRWELRRLLGQGEWTSVYQARPLASASTAAADYAVKIPRPGADQSMAVRLLRREAEVARQVSHPHLAAVLTAHLDTPPYFLVQPYLPGVTLALALASRGPMQARQALWIGRQTAEALSQLHEKEWRHGDVKPENIIVSSAGHATLIDLGFARRTSGAECRPGGDIMGTFAYTAPEIFTSSLRSDGRSDIYSLGVVLFEMLTGQRPFQTRQIDALVTMHLEQPAPEARRFMPHLSRRLARVLRRFLAKEPLRRPTAAEAVGLLAELEIDALGDC